MFQNKIKDDAHIQVGNKNDTGKNGFLSSCCCYIFCLSSDHNEDDKFGSNCCLLRGWKPVIILGRFLGAISRTDILDFGERSHRQYRKINLASLFSLAISFYLLFNAILIMRHNFDKFKYDKTTLVKLEGFNHAGYAVCMFIIYLYQLFSSKKLRNIIQHFAISNKVSRFPSFVTRRGISRYPVFSGLVLAICLFLDFVENVLYDWQNINRGRIRQTKSVSTLELYYQRNFNHWHVVFPEYNLPATLLMIIFTKLGTWGWAYIDVVCVLLCRALWEKLWIIAEKLRWSPFRDIKLVENSTVTTILGLPLSNCEPPQNQQNPDVFKEEYVIVTDLVEQVQNYISPMIVVSYVANMYILIVMLFNWIGPFSTEGVSREKTIHVSFSFFQFLFRVAFITYFAGEVHQMSLEIRRNIQMCPNWMYTTSLERLERILMASPTGICLFGSFMITRKFFVSVVSFIFTTEIVLLQSYSNYNNVQNSTKTE